MERMYSSVYMLKTPHDCRETCNIIIKYSNTVIHFDESYMCPQSLGQTVLEVYISMAAE
jgi:hypothetical protein